MVRGDSYLNFSSAHTSAQRMLLYLMVYLVNIKFFILLTQQTNPQISPENRKSDSLFYHFNVEQPASCGPSAPRHMHTAALERCEITNLKRASHWVFPNSFQCMYLLKE